MCGGGEGRGGGGECVGVLNLVTACLGVCCCGKAQYLWEEMACHMVAIPQA